MTKSNSKAKRSSRTAEVEDGSQLASTSLDPEYEEDRQYGSGHPEFRMEYSVAPKGTRKKWIQSLSSKVKKSEANIFQKVDRGEFHDFMLAQNILSPGPLKRIRPAGPPTAASTSQGPSPSRQVEEGSTTTAGEGRPATSPEKNTAFRIEEDELYMFSFGGPGPSKQWDSVVITENIIIREYLGKHPGIDLYLRQAPRRIPFEVDRSTQGFVATLDLAAGTRIIWERPLLVATQVITHPVFLKIDQLLQQEAATIRQKVVDLLGRNTPLDPAVHNETMAVLETMSFDVPFFPSESNPMRAVFERISRCRRMPAGGNARFNFEHATFCGEIWATKDIAPGEQIIISP
ncbi:hypothetical protein CALVIDRAFT_557035 [Calocera viscosa TUFC12733]|uniref:Uncharacterized protein n=1 Tax=Calocera viscosa (strain TUFC12733) TaxID=1330018 RepID=A0A167J9N6_CALVF|nr:hypothetical protein CALVIDRAFT_557035 [Calocera viscosa TUFC12733]